tara:strand:- start:1858 stop:2334 length:477 start_codon:yes stop_codon:yes gene_type:complete
MNITYIDEFSSDDYNKLILDTKNNRHIIRIFLRDDPTYNKFMIIKDCLPLRDASGNLPLYALQGDDVSYLYNYGAFYPHKKKYMKVLTEEERSYIYTHFQSSGCVIFGERVKSIVIYKNEDMIKKIEDPVERDWILRINKDIKKYNWQPSENCCKLHS